MVVDTDGRRHMGPSSGGALGPCKHTRLVLCAGVPPMRRQLAVARLSHRSAAKGEAWGRECSAGPSLPDMARRIRRDEEEADPAAESFRGPAWQQVGVRRGACCDVLGARCSVPAVPEQYVCTCVCAVRVSTAGPAQRPSRARRAHRRKHILTDARTPCQATHRRRPARRPRQLRGSSAHPAVAEPSRAEPSQAKPSQARTRGAITSGMSAPTAVPEAAASARESGRPEGSAVSAASGAGVPCAKRREQSPCTGVCTLWQHHGSLARASALGWSRQAAVAGDP